MATFRSGKEDRLHSVSMSPDNENFITADEGRVDLWNIDKTKDSVYSLVEYKDKSPADYNGRILSAKFNQSSGYSFMYTTSLGSINICDLRESSNFHSRASVSFQSVASKTSTPDIM